MPATLREAARLLEQAADRCKDDQPGEAWDCAVMALRVIRRVHEEHPRSSPHVLADELTPDVQPHERQEVEEP